MDALYLKNAGVFSEQFGGIVDLIAENGRTEMEVTGLPQNLSLTGRHVKVGKLSARICLQKWWWGPGVVGE